MLVSLLFLGQIFSALTGGSQRAPSAYAPVINEGLDIVSHGENVLQTYQKEEGACWKNLVVGFDDQCGNMQSDKLVRLAIAMTNCHLSTSGLPVGQCDETMSNEDCVRELEAKGRFTEYTSFFVKAIAICQYLQRDQFNVESREAVIALYRNAKTTAANLQQVATQTETLVKSMETSNIFQKELEAGQKELNADLTRLREEESLRYKSTASQMENLQQNTQVMTKQMSDSVENQKHLLEEQAKLSEGQDRLMSTVNSMSQTLNETAQLQDDIASKQAELATAQQSALEQGNKVAESIKISIENEKALLQHQKDSFDKLEQLQETQRSGMEKLQVTLDFVLDRALDVRKQFAEITEGLGDVLDAARGALRLQQMLAGEFFGIKSFLMYFIAFVLAGGITSSERTRSARLPLFLIILVAAVTERMTVPINITAPGITQEYWQWVSLVRRVAFAIAALMFTRVFLNYKSPAQIQKEQLDQILRVVEAQAAGQQRCESCTVDAKMPPGSPAGPLRLPGSPIRRNVVNIESQHNHQHEHGSSNGGGVLRNYATSQTPQRSTTTTTIHFPILHPSHLSICNCGAPNGRHYSYQCLARTTAVVPIHPSIAALNPIPFTPIGSVLAAANNTNLAASIAASEHRPARRLRFNGTASN